MPKPNQRWVEELDFTIEEWTARGGILEMLGRVHLYEMAISAYSAAKQMRPNGIIRLRQWTRVIEERVPTR